MRRSLLLLAAAATLLATAAGLFWLSESRRLGARLAWLEQRTRDLESDLAGALAQRDALSTAVAEKALEEQAEREARERRQREALAPLPEGVRLALLALNALLAEDGFALRLLGARAIEGKELRGVEALERDPDGLRTHLLLAGKLTLTLDRAASALELRFCAGERVSGGVAVALPAEGWPLTLAPVDGPAWEARLPYLLEVRGDYAAPPAPAAAPPRLDAEVRAAWLERFARLLEPSRGDLAWRLERLDGVAEGAFTGVLLLGYDARKTLAASVEAARLTVAIDRRAGTVELRLGDGVLRRAQGETRIGAEGYAILLPGVSPEHAAQALLGMVAER